MDENVSSENVSEVSKERASTFDSENEAQIHRTKTQTLKVVCCILVMELCERLTYYSIMANLVLFCTSRLGFSSETANYIVQIFSGTCYLVPVFGGYIADSISGKYNAIYAAGLIYVCGVFLLPVSAVDYTSWFGLDSDGLKYDLDLRSRRGYFLFGLGLVALGTGGIKANVAPFGAQQLEGMGPAMMQKFFNWFYWFINAGSFVAYLAVAYVQQNIGFDLGFFIPLLSMILAMVFLIAGRNTYIHHPPTGSMITKSFTIIRQGIQRRKIVKSKQKDGDTTVSFFDGAKKQYGGSFDTELVDGITSSLKVLPIFFTIIFYWAIYSQMTSTFFLQGELMNASLGKTTMPIAALNIFNVVIILVLIPIMDRIYNLLEEKNYRLTALQRIGIGLVLAAGSVIVAGIVEIYRKKELHESGGMVQILASEKFNASHISIFFQIPQFALVGSSEVFTSITGLEFAYSQAPETLKGLLMGIFLLTSGLGNYVSTAVVAIVKVITAKDPWFTNDINLGHMEYLFFLLGIIMLVDFFFFLFLTKILRFKKVDENVENIENVFQIKVNTEPEQTKF